MVKELNKYILFLQNCYTKQVTVLDVENHSDDHLFFKFTELDLDDMTPGEYNYALVWCTVDYEVKLSNDLLDCELTFNEGTFKLRDLTPDTGMILIKEENKPAEAPTVSIDEKVHYYSL